MMPAQPAPLITQEAIRTRIAELGLQIARDYTPTTPIVLIGVLRGALYFLADLSRHLPQPVEIDLIRVSSYDGTNSTGTVTLLQDIQIDIQGKEVIIVEDIVDTGRTLNALCQHFLKLSPKRIKTCALLDKPSRREVNVPVHYTGFRIPDHFVVGFGLDYNQTYRNLPYIGVLTDV